MEKAIGSKISLIDLENDIAISYMNCVEDLLNNKKVKRLESFTHHHYSTRLQHSLNVSYYSFLICKLFGWDYRSVARAGILHDLYFYDRHRKSKKKYKHCSWHPKVAYDNARKMFDINEIEKDAILNHMWPATVNLPKYKESYVLSIVDTFCALFEFFEGFKKLH